MEYELYFPTEGITLNLRTETPISNDEQFRFTEKMSVYAPGAAGGANAHRKAAELAGRTFQILRIDRLISEIDNSRIGPTKNLVRVTLK